VGQAVLTGHVSGVEKRADLEIGILRTRPGRKIENVPPQIPDSEFTMALIATVVAASVLLCRGRGGLVVVISHFALALRSHAWGKAVRREAVIAAETHWRRDAWLCDDIRAVSAVRLAFRPILSTL